MQLFQHVIRTIFGIFLDALMFLQLCLRPTATVAAENLFLRKELGLFVERKVKARRATDSIRFTLARLSRWFDWREALIVVRPDTLSRWHRKGFRLFWKWKSRPRRRPRIPSCNAAFALLRRGLPEPPRGECRGRASLTPA